MYLDESDKPVVTRCGVYVAPYKQCEQRLEVVEQPQHAAQYVARCPVHGVGPIWRQDHLYPEEAA